MHGLPSPRGGRRVRFAPLGIAAGLIATALLGLSTTGTLSAFTASITNSTNTAASGSIVMKETDSAGSVNCLSTSGSNNSYTSCSTINKYGGTGSLLTPGSAGNVTTVRMYNTGTLAVGGFTIAPGSCTNTPTSGNLCSQLVLTVTCAPVTGGTIGTAVTLYNGTALGSLSQVDIKNASTTCVPPISTSNYVQFQFTVQLPSSADNTTQAQTVSQPIVWTYTA